MTPIHLLLFLMSICLFILLFITSKYPYSHWRIFSKALCSSLFILIGFYAFQMSSAPLGYAIPLFIGLLLSGLGDLFLGFSDQKPLKNNRLFALGVIAFSLAHIAFSIAFLSLGHLPSTIYLIIPLTMVIGFHYLTSNHYFDFQGFRKLIYLYSFIIVSMMIIGICNVYQLRNTYEFFTLAGILFFVLSDVILFFFYFFHKKHKLITTFNLLTYYIAQLFLALSLLYF